MLAGMSSRPNPIPLRPDFSALEREQRRSLHRAITAITLAGQDRSPSAVLKSAWPYDDTADMIVRAAVSPTLTANYPAFQAVTVLPNLAPASAAIRLFNASMTLDMAGVATVRVPHAVTVPTPLFVAEGSAAPTVQIGLAATDVGPVRKILILAAVSGELERATPETASKVVGKLDFAGVYQYVIPYPSAVPIPLFIAEGAPHPIVQDTFTTTTVGPTHKILIGSALTGELENYSADAAAEIIGNVLVDQVARNLDAYLFDAVAGSAVRSPGLLYNVTPISPAPAGSTLAKDIAAIVSAITLAGGHLENVVFVGGAFATTALRLAAGPQFTFPVFGTGSVADKTIIGIDASAIASGYSGLPSIETTKQATVHMEDTNPLQLATGAQGSGVLATPMRSAFQTDTLLLRIRLSAAWSVLRPGAVQVINGVNW